MLSSKDRAAINRANAQKSTGPRTDTGKQRSAMNAFRHGFTGQIRLLTEEDRCAYLEFQQSFLDAYTPKGPVETQCVQSMVDAAWQLNRTSAWQDQILSLGSTTLPPQASASNPPQVNSALAEAEAVSRLTRDLMNLSMYAQRYHKLFERSHDRLLMLQEKRAQQERQQLHEAAKHLQLHRQEQREAQLEHEAAQAEIQAAALRAGNELPARQAFKPEEYDPTADGFVLQVAEIEAYIRRSQRDDEARDLYAQHKGRFVTAAA